MAILTRPSHASPVCLTLCSCAQVYNDKLNDMLSRPVRHDLRMREVGGGKGVTAEGLHLEVVTSVEEVMDCLKRGQDQRVVAPMAMNARSSRGHGIFTIHVKEMMASGPERQMKLNLVDLAGMESSKKSAPINPDKRRQEEASNINRSLYSLGSVIEKLSSAGAKAHIPWRDSKLTRLLQDSLGGNCKATIMVTLRTEDENIDECQTTLRFAQRAKVVPVLVPMRAYQCTETKCQCHAPMHQC